jgi:hypothetical protein
MSSGSIVEGGNYHCFVDGFETKDMEEWSKHCLKEKHTETGIAPCYEECGAQVTFAHIPYTPRYADGKLARRIKVRCAACTEKLKQELLGE